MGWAGVMTDVMRATLEQLRLEGALFFRGEFTDGFAFESAPLAFADTLVGPGADRMILFHIVARGSCWTSIDDGVRHWARAGDVIVLPYGDRYTMGGEVPVETAPLSVPGPPPWETIPVFRIGGGGQATDVVCGYLHSEHPLFDPAMRALPPLFVVRLPVGPAADWVQASITYAMQATAPSDRSTSLIATRLPELVLIEVLRAHLATAPAADRGWLAALRDPILAPALSLMHGSPGRHWTVSDLAFAAAVSRSQLDERFRQVLGRSPIRYLTEWRMHLAEELLGSAELTVLDIAHRVGYESHEAFSRAFKRTRGMSPAHWRASRREAGPSGHASRRVPARA